MCAIEAGKRGRRVAVLERAQRIGKKILISGGGRCNFTNIHCRAENFISANPHFAKSALARYTPSDFIALVEKHRIAYHEKALGQLFCNRSAQDVVSILEEECRHANVRVFTGVMIQEVRRASEFQVHTSNEEFRSNTLVVATGGLSIPKMGASAFGYDLARQFQLKIEPTRPALVPLVLATEDRKRWCDLAGVSVDVTTSVKDASFHEKMLITHRGLSGPAILQISTYWDGHSPIRLDLAPGKQVLESMQVEHARKDAATLRSCLRAAMPNRFADRWLENRPPHSWSRHALGEYERAIHEWQVTPEGTEGFDKAEVTAGGIDTDELNSKTMEAKRVPGLFFIGEIVDVTGHLGGFNFQWAWSSGFCAGNAV
jgi:predicted Rossmann fold flavoprotein